MTKSKVDRLLNDIIRECDSTGGYYMKIGTIKTLIDVYYRSQKKVSPKLHRYDDEFLHEKERIQQFLRDAGCSLTYPNALFKAKVISRADKCGYDKRVKLSEVLRFYGLDGLASDVDSL